MTKAPSQKPPASGGVSIRDIGPADLDWLLCLNNASVPHVNHLERDGLAEILGKAAYARCVLQGDRPSGAMITLWPGTDYASLHYDWFSQNHADFLYIDRVMIDVTAKKRGLGRRLYADAEDIARSGNARYLACEVNSQPPNPVSMRFHEALGFHPVGELANEDRSKCVVLMMKTLSGAPQTSG